MNQFERRVREVVDPDLADLRRLFLDTEHSDIGSDMTKCCEIVKQKLEDLDEKLDQILKEIRDQKPTEQRDPRDWDSDDIPDEWYEQIYHYLLQWWEDISPALEEAKRDVARSLIEWLLGLLLGAVTGGSALPLPPVGLKVTPRIKDNKNPGAIAPAIATGLTVVSAINQSLLTDAANRMLAGAANRDSGLAASIGRAMAGITQSNDTLDHLLECCSDVGTSLTRIERKVDEIGGFRTNSQVLTLQGDISWIKSQLVWLRGHL